MLDCREFYNALRQCEIHCIAGVPDSLLKNFLSYAHDHDGLGPDRITANEGSAVALATGHYLATGQPGLVYMQNSGLGNAVNPLTSLADRDVYGIPMLLLIGWRGEPGVADEPQHRKKGALTLPLLETLGIEHQVLPDTMDDAVEAVRRGLETARAGGMPYALVVRKGTFAPYALRQEARDDTTLGREDAIRQVVERLDPRDVIVSTTGKPSRELFEHRVASGSPIGRDFLTVGSMGHASQIAVGIALARPDRQVVCLDGDGALIMHMGSLAFVGQQGPANFRHIVLNNGCHQSVGGQPTAGFDIDIPAIALGCGYRRAARVGSAEELDDAVDALRREPGPALLEVRVARGSRSDLGRPTATPHQARQAFMDFLQS
jgi:phosphonopyruvate decarboxylase